MNKKNHVPLIHISKRKALPWYRAWAIRGAAILLALVACALVTMLLTGENPLSIYATMLQGAFGTPRKLWILGQDIAILLCISLAVTPAFKMRFWNIGGEGQVLIGGLATAACMIYLGDMLPNWLLILVMVAASIAAGAIWAVIPAIFKAKWNTNDTLFTLMMNYVATQLVAFAIVWQVPKGTGKLGIINQVTQAGWLPQIGEYKYLLNILIVAALTVGMYVYLNYSKHGYEISVVGESERTARYVGIKVEKVIIRTMLLSGAVCGIAGLLLVGVLPYLRCQRNLHHLPPESLLWRYPHGHHPVLHHRQRVFHHLSDSLPQVRKGGALSTCLILFPSSPAPWCRAFPCSMAPPARP